MFRAVGNLSVEPASCCQRPTTRRCVGTGRSRVAESTSEPRHPSVLVTCNLDARSSVESNSRSAAGHGYTVQPRSSPRRTRDELIALQGDVRVVVVEAVCIDLQPEAPRRAPPENEHRRPAERHHDLVGVSIPPSKLSLREGGRHGITGSLVQRTGAPAISTC